MILIIGVRMDAEYLMGPALRHAVLQDKVLFFYFFILFFERERESGIPE